MTEYVITEEWQWPDDPYGSTTVLCVAHSKEAAMAWVEKYADEHHHPDEYRFTWNKSKTTYYAWGPHGNDYTGYKIKPVKVV